MDTKRLLCCDSGSPGCLWEFDFLMIHLPLGLLHRVAFTWTSQVGSQWKSQARVTGRSGAKHLVYAWERNRSTMNHCPRMAWSSVMSLKLFPWRLISRISTYIEKVVKRAALTGFLIREQMGATQQAWGACLAYQAQEMQGSPGVSANPWASTSSGVTPRAWSKERQKGLYGFSLEGVNIFTLNRT